MNNIVNRTGLFLLMMWISIGSAYATNAAGTYTLQKGANNSTYLETGQYVIGYVSTNMRGAPAFSGAGAQNLKGGLINSYMTGSYYALDEVCTLTLDGSEGVCEWTVTNDGYDSYTIYDGTYYMCAKSDNKNKLWASTTTTGNNATWEITHHKGVSYTACSVINEAAVDYDHLANSGETLSGYGSGTTSKIYFFKKTADLYDITLSDDYAGGGNNTMDARVGGVIVTKAAEDATVTLSQTANPNYCFDSWYVVDEDDDEVTVTSNTFTMPAKDVTVYPIYTGCGTNATVTAASSESISQTTATVRCASGISSKGDACCAITEYGFVISAKATNSTPTIGGSGVTKHQIGTSYTTLSTAFSKALTSLTASTTYCVRAYAINGYGTAYSAVHEFTTSAEVQYGNYVITCADHYTVTYAANTGEDPYTGSLPTDANEYTTGETVYISNGTIGRTGYDFVGWNTNPAATTAITEFVMGSSNATVYAIWSPIDYTLTMAASPSSLNTSISAPVAGGNSVTKHIGDEVTVTTAAAPAHFTFSGWTSSNGGTFTNTSSLSTTFTMPASNTTVTANYTEEGHYTIIYKEEDDTEIDRENWYVSEDATLPTLSPCTDWRFVGWVTSKVASETTSKPATIYTTYPRAAANTTITLYPLYSHMANGDGDESDLLPANIGSSNSTYNEFSSKTYNSSAVYCGKAAKDDAYIALNSPSNSSYIASSTSGGNLKSVTISAKCKSASGSSVYIYGSNTAIDTYSKATSATRVATLSAPYNTPSTQTYNFTSDYSYIAIVSAAAVQIKDVCVTWTTGTLKYATHCSDPTGYTIKYDANANDASTTCTDETVSNAALALGHTLCGNATRDGYSLYKWNTSRDGSGTSYNPTETVTSLPATVVKLYAQWRKKVSFDIGANATGTVADIVDTDNDGNITLPNPSLTIAGGSCDWVLVGWTETALPAATTEKPTTLLPVSTTYSGSAHTLYAVYRRQFSNPNGFTLSSLVDPSKYVGANSSAVASGSAITLYTAKRPAGGEYLYYYIDTDVRKYIYYAGSSTTISLTENAASADGWNITKVGDDYRFVPTNGASRYYYWNGSDNFNCGTTSRVLKKTATTGVYFSYAYLPTCATLVNLSFDAAGGTVNYADGYPESSYKNLTNPTTVDHFPTATPPAGYENWHFIGWYNGTFNTNQTDAPAVIYDDDHSYDVSSDITLHALFTTYGDNGPFDDVNGGEYYIYFYRDNAKYQDDYYSVDSHLMRVYAQSPISGTAFNHTFNCSDAQLFNFIPQDGGKWDIKIGDKWLVNTSNNDFRLVNSQPASKWTITPDGARYTISYDGNALNTPNITRLIKAFEENSTTWKFKCYGTDQVESSYYYKTYLGTCEERIYATNPANIPNIIVNGQAKITSTAGKAIKSTTVLSVTASNVSTASLTVSSDNPHFTVSPTTIPVTNRTAGPTSITISYNPEATTDGIEDATITVSDGAGNPTSVSTTAGDVQGRHLPANFVIAAKWNDNWYALPANCTTSSSSTAGILIEVDNASDPTTATLAPDYTKYGLREVASGRYAANGSNITFVEKLTTSPAREYTLYNGNTTSIQVNAQWSGYSSTNPEKYEWVPSTDDFKDYTLTSATGDGRTVSLNNNGVFGTLSQDKSYDGMVRLLPATFYEESPVQVLEWKANSVVVMYTGTETSATTRVGANSASSAQTLADQKLTYGIYELTTSQALTSNDGKVLLLSFGDTKKTFDVPIIINSDVTASDGHSKQDVVIVNGGKLTSAGTKYSYRNVYVYGGGKLDISSGSLGVNNIILRAGGVTTDGSGGSATYAYVYPQVKLGGTLSSTVTDIKYEYITDYDHWYHLCLPFDAVTSTIKYPTEYYGDNVTANNTGSWIIKRYDGATRATGNYNAWVDIESAGEPTPTTVSAGHGYIFWGAPKKVTIGTGENATQRQKWGIQRFTMSTTAAAATTAETANKTISGLGSYSGVDNNSGKNNDQGWNLIGNPYMVNLTGLNSTSLQVGQLVHTDTDPWDGKWKWDETDPDAGGLRYVTIPDDHFDNYNAQTMTWFTAENPMKTGRAFFVQIAGLNTSVVFASANRASLMPAWERRAEAEQKVDIETGIVLSDDDEMRDEVNFWIKNDKTEAYEYNADYPKTPNNTNFNIYGVHEVGQLSWVAISPEIAEGSMAIGYQVPAAGDYTLSLSETYVSDKIEALYVTDHEVTPEFTTNLMEDTYSFGVKQAERNDTRFTARIVLKDEAQVPTDVGNIDGMESEHPLKFLYRDKLYILRNGVLYDATGKKVK